MAYQSGQSVQVTIPGPGPWGFRLAGGKDFNTPLHISKLTPGGKAAQANLLPNDTVATINGIDTSALTHLEAQNKIKAVVGDLHLNIQRGGSNIWKPKITDSVGSSTPAVNVDITADKQKFTHAGSSHNGSSS
ncbi:PDZ and LIM domain protein 1-like [Amphiura filiformis]|uniref:PDZ and LIM domain protein 1-like n=1 Tax=Amphiura filiformis TaxID=82378 RepID=UPI003B21F201